MSLIKLRQVFLVKCLNSSRCFWWKECLKFQNLSISYLQKFISISIIHLRIWWFCLCLFIGRFVVLAKVGVTLHVILIGLKITVLQRLLHPCTSSTVVHLVILIKVYLKMMVLGLNVLVITRNWRYIFELFFWR